MGIRTFGNVGQMTFQAISEKSLDKVLELTDQTDKAISETLKKLARQAKTKIIQGINTTPRTGNVYYYYGEKRRRSVPYNSHANETGNLKRSLSWKTRGSEGMEIGYGLFRWYGDADKYAERIELGGEDRLGRVIDPRPSIDNVLDDADFNDIFKSEMGL